MDIFLPSKQQLVTTLSGDNRFLKLVTTLLFTLIFLIVPVIALEPITPNIDETTQLTQPLFSWTSSTNGTVEHYHFTLSNNENLASPYQEFDQASTYYQAPILTAGQWYWQVEAYELQDITNNQTNQTTEELVLIDKTDILSFTIEEEKIYTVTVDTQHYESNKRVDFITDAPLGSSLSLLVTKNGFSLPFSTQNLQTDTFTSFMDSGLYTLTANFTVNGIFSTYTDQFVLAKRTSTTPAGNTYFVLFNLTDENYLPLEDGDISFQHYDTKDYYNETTNESGLASFNLPKGLYSIIVEHDEYYDDDFKKEIQQNRTINLAIFPLEESTTQETTTVASTSNAPTVAIISPEYKEEITGDLTVGFTLSSYSALRSCGLQLREKNQQGWVLGGTVTALSAANVITVEPTVFGEVQLKVVCTSTLGSTYESGVRTVVLPKEIEHNEAIADFLEEITEAAAELPSSQEALYLYLQPKKTIQQAKKTLDELDKKYIRLQENNDEDALNALEKTIQETISELRKTVIVSFSVTERDELSTTINTQAANLLLEWYIKKTQLIPSDIPEKKQAHIQELIKDEQENFAFRAKYALAEITYLDGSTNYLTSFTRTTQAYLDSDSFGSYIVLEELPLMFLQQTGTPTVIDSSGKETGKITDGRLEITLQPQKSYTFIFSGNVKNILTALDTVAVIPDKDYANEETQQSNLITGKVTGIFSSTSGISAFLLVVLFGGLFLFVLKPVYTTSGKKKTTTQSTPVKKKTHKNTPQKTPSRSLMVPFSKKTKKNIREVTDSVHDALDLLEKGLFDQAREQYTSLLSQYDTLAPQHQQELSFAVTLLASEINAQSLNQTLVDVSSRVSVVSSLEDLQYLKEQSTWVFNEYKNLDEAAKEKVKPQLTVYRSWIEAKLQQFSTTPEQQTFEVEEVGSQEMMESNVIIPEENDLDYPAHNASYGLP